MCSGMGISWPDSNRIPNGMNENIATPRNIQNDIALSLNKNTTATRVANIDKKVIAISKLENCSRNSG